MPINMLLGTKGEAPCNAKYQTSEKYLFPFQIGVSKNI